MNNKSKLKEMGRQQIMAAIVECTEKLGEVPSQPQLTKMTNFTKLQIRKHFGSYAHALRACKLEKSGGGWKITMEALFQDWAMVVRALGKLPSVTEYEQTSQYSQTPLVKRFGTWGQVPHGLKQYIEEQGREEEWKDILEKIVALDTAQEKQEPRWNGIARTAVREGMNEALITQASITQASISQTPVTQTPVTEIPIANERSGFGRGGGTHRAARAGGFRFGPPNGAGWRAKVLEDRPIYGPLMNPSPLAHGPTNEMGVLFLFGTVAAQLGFVVTWVRSEFPDCEAMILVGPEKWQRIRIEFEYESRNFLKHMHDAKECDLIVCWKHNWPECPVEVLELSSMIA
jgi:predicted secreted protein